DRAGFKAGNLNHALRKALSEVDYFCVVDSDEILPANFVRETVAIAESDKTIGFVQVGHRTYGDTCFGTQTGGDVDLHWNYYLTEKIDVLVGATVIFLPITFIAFIFVFHLLAPFLLLGVPNSVLGAVRSAQEVTSTFNSFHGWDFCAFVLVTVLAPACYLIPS